MLPSWNYLCCRVEGTLVAVEYLLTFPWPKYPNFFGCRGGVEYGG